MLANSSNNGILRFIDELRGLGIRLHLEGDRLRVNAPKGAIDDGLKATLAARRTEIVEALKQGDDEFNTGGIVRISREKPLPLSFAQSSLLLLQQMEPDRSDYNVGGGVRLQGPFDIELMKKAINELVFRHETLRTRLDRRDSRFA